MSINGISKLYSFIRQIGGFNNFKRAVDMNHDNTIQIGELRQFISENAYLSTNISNSDINNIWQNLDTFVTGENSYSAQGVPENGSLNKTEEDKMKEKYQFFGQIYNTVANIVNSQVPTEALVQNNMQYCDGLSYAISSEDLIMAVCDKMLDDPSVTLGNAAEKAKEKVLLTCKELITNEMKKAPKFAEILADKLPSSNYSLFNDLDLGSLITKYLDTVTDFNGLKSVAEKVYRIIVKYLDSALLFGGTASAPAGTEVWDTNTQGCNTLQKAVIDAKINKEIDDLISYEYDGDKIIDYAASDNSWSYKLDTGVLRSNVRNAIFDKYNNDYNEIAKLFVDGTLKDEIEQIARDTVKDMIFEEQCNQQIFKDKLEEYGLGDYDLAADADLQRFLEEQWKEISLRNKWDYDNYHGGDESTATINTGKHCHYDLLSFAWMAMGVIRNYLKDAGIDIAANNPDITGEFALANSQYGHWYVTCEDLGITNSKLKQAVENSGVSPTGSDDPPTPENEVNFDYIDYQCLDSIGNNDYRSWKDFHDLLPKLKKQLKNLVGNTLTDNEFNQMWNNSFSGMYETTSPHHGQETQLKFTAEYCNSDGSVDTSKVAHAIVNNFKNLYDEKFPQPAPTPNVSNFDDITYNNLTMSNSTTYSSLDNLYAVLPEIKNQLKSIVGNNKSDSEFEQMWKDSFKGTYSTAIDRNGNTVYKINSEYLLTNPRAVDKNKYAHAIVNNFKDLYEK